MIVGLSAVVMALLAWAVWAYNRLVRQRNQVQNAWADIDVQLQRRHDLVPQLVEVTRAYAAHEQSTLEAVTTLRARARGAQGARRQGEAEAALASGLDRLIALSEAYPELKANQNFSQLSAALIEVENHLQYARRFYNGAVRDNNDTVQRVPDVLIARGFGFGLAEFFQAEGQARDAPQVALT